MPLVCPWCQKTVETQELVLRSPKLSWGQDPTSALCCPHCRAPVAFSHKHARAHLVAIAVLAIAWPLLWWSHVHAGIPTGWVAGVVPAVLLSATLVFKYRSAQLVRA